MSIQEPTREQNPDAEQLDQNRILTALQGRAGRLYFRLKDQPLNPVLQRELLGPGHYFLGFLSPFLGQGFTNLRAWFAATAQDPSKACAEIFSHLYHALPRVPLEYLATHDTERVVLTDIADYLTLAEGLLEQQAPEKPTVEGEDQLQAKLAERIASLTSEKVLEALKSAPKDPSSPDVDSLAKKEKLATFPLMNSAHEAWDNAIVHSIENLALFPALWKSLLKIPPRILPEANAPDDTPSTRRALATAWEKKYRDLLRYAVSRARAAAGEDLARLDTAYVELAQLGPRVVRILSAGHLALHPYNTNPIPRNLQDDDPYQLADDLQSPNLMRSDGYHARYVVRYAQLYTDDSGRQVLIPGEVC